MLQCFIIGSKIQYCVYFWASWTSFSVITSPNRNLCGWNLEYKWRGTVRTHSRKMGEIAPGVPPQSAKACFVLCYQYNAAFRPLRPILHRFRPFFETTHVNRFPHACTGENFPNFCAGVFPRDAPKQPQIRYSGVGCLCMGCTSNGIIVGDGNHFGASRHPKDVPFVREFWWRRTVWAL